MLATIPPPTLIQKKRCDDTLYPMSENGRKWNQLRRHAKEGEPHFILEKLAEVWFGSMPQVSITIRNEDANSLLASLIVVLRRKLNFETG